MKSMVSFKNACVALILLVVFLPIDMQAQCAMCRAALETSGDVKQGEAMNNGIMYLMAIPYIVVAVIGIVLYRSRQSARKVQG